MIRQICNRCMFVLFAITHLYASAGTFVNPLTDICWKCIFPIHLAGVNITPGSKDFAHYQPGICACAGTPPKIGIPLAFWEPVALIDVTKTPFKSLSLGGISLGSGDGRGQGGLSHIGDSGRHSFYHAHYYKFPILGLLGLLPGFSCIEKAAEFDIGYLSELDPFWSDDSWKDVMTPEAALFANPPAQAACIADCMASNLDEPRDELFWCAGCSGSLYPLMGHVSHHVGAIQASYLIAQRVLAKVHSLGMIKGADKHSYCGHKLMPRIKKSIYKTQLIQPIPNTKGPCHPLGKSDVLWGSGKSYPYGGEEFVYLIWAKRHCCLDSVKTTAIITGGLQ